ncbi:hypothetical protein DNI29_05540 [Hymenobacter sediminis]|uniref:hypothetical protein n=1 Tax=Hymenobacter sediminis TaxID=2218621 RepID=UPI000DA646B5|nr:hypothetical protein [Hymenobacter sediminis]RPD50259.1 hypothetical protein DNI29_05540 [Hymenobacter sediminis]
MKVSLAILIAAIAFLLASCSTYEYESPDNSNDGVAGIANVLILSDSKRVNEHDMVKYFRIILITTHDTFLLQPINSKIIFPKLHHPLIRATILFKDFVCEGYDGLLKNEQGSFYFPDADTAKFVLDHYPFETEGSKRWKNLSKNQIYFEVNAKNGRRFYGKTDKAIYQK